MLPLFLMAALAVSPTTGNLVVSADMPFALFVDGRQVNPANLQTSWTVSDLGAGRHALKVEGCSSPFSCRTLAEGFLEVPGGSEVRVKAEPGKLVVYETVGLLAPPEVVVQQPAMVAIGLPTAQVVVGDGTASVAVQFPGQAVQPPPSQVVVVQPAAQPAVMHVEHRYSHGHHPHANPMAMSPGDFGALKSAMQAEGFEAQRLDVLRTAASSAWFTVDQVGQLTDLFAFSKGKVEVVAVCKPRMVDPQNGYQLYSHFTFTGDKEKVRSILGQ